ncbi:type II toxin-antitoxin system Phd/YefM family antitoxin [Aquamicrobium sp. LC103]|uniref:type II toxin-antitoxin system Phd/YefM family antitoxin n=1 Tax=Aquamicrobium sp. LC103 TaxID=1120658 RepID=UPI00063E96F3|nr:type II toxin-antitoxin system Phd/YefM family antitoxin [Aquamicrobium sp. LC103]TKT82979.1 type II toxin-antitoxin system Phd/YefM family antitoxin [Aquamicrobium sp. LC103]
MKTVQVREAKAGLSALIDAAENGEPTIITRHGKPAAVVVSVEDARKLYPLHRPNLGTFLTEFPGGVEFERSESRMREVKL